MNISQLEKFDSLPKSLLENEIRFASTSSEDLFILKIRERDSDFNGNPIQKPENNIRTQSILWFNLNNGTVSEVVPFGDFDINSFYVTRKYIYYERITDVNHDGFLSEDDYRNGEIWRVDRSTFVQELCFKVNLFNLHQILSANDDFIIFTSEDRLPAVTELVFVNIPKNQYAVIHNIYESDWCDFRLVNNKNREPDYFIFNQEVGMGNVKMDPEIKMIRWLDLIPQLIWEKINAD